MGQFIRIVGLVETEAALKRLPAFARLHAQEAINVTAFTIARRAASRAPRLTGRLQAAVTWQARPRSLSAVVGADKSEAFYWKFHEYGTVKKPARPFFRPTAEAERSAHEQRMQRALAKATEQTERSSGTSRLL